MSVLDRWRDTPRQQTQQPAVLQTLSAHRLVKKLGKLDTEMLEGVLDTALSEFQLAVRMWRSQQIAQALDQAAEQAETLLEVVRELMRRSPAH